VSSRPDLLVLDWRGRTRLGLDDVLSQLCDHFSRFPVCAIVSAKDMTRRVETLGYSGSVITGAIFPDAGPVGLLIRAYLNNSPNGFAAAQAVAFVLAVLPVGSAEILNFSICSGFTASSVKECAAILGLDRGTLRRRIQVTGKRAITPRLIIDLAKMSFAIGLLVTTGASVRSISRSIGFNSTASLHHALERLCKLSPVAIREQGHNETLESYLDRLAPRIRSALAPARLSSGAEIALRAPGQHSDATGGYTHGQTNTPLERA
jgi:AraC-like DNA-binding protein